MSNKIIRTGQFSVRHLTECKMYEILLSHMENKILTIAINPTVPVLAKNLLALCVSSDVLPVSMDNPG